MPHHHMQHMRNVGPILFTRNESIVHIMPHVTTLREVRALPTSCHMLPHVECRHAHTAQCTHTGKPATLIICGTPGITYGHAVRAG